MGCCRHHIAVSQQEFWQGSSQHCDGQVGGMMLPLSGSMVGWQMVLRAFSMPHCQPGGKCLRGLS